MTLSKHLVLGLAALSIAGLSLSPALAQAPRAAPRTDTAPPAEKFVPTFKVPSLQSCMNLSRNDLLRTPACNLLLEQTLSIPEIDQLTICWQMSAEDRAANDACKAIWAKAPDIVKLRTVS